MAGRAVVRTMHPFMAAELGGLFDLPGALERGMLPLVHGAVHPLRHVAELRRRLRA